MPRHHLIVSSLPGRLRLQGPLLRQPEASRTVAEILFSIPGLISVTPNLAAGSLLICYDVQQHSQASTEEQINATLCTRLNKIFSNALPHPTNQKPRTRIRQWNRIAKIGMIASFPLSLLFAATGHKRLHVLTGLAFTAMMTVHAGIYRRQLTR